MTKLRDNQIQNLIREFLTLFLLKIIYKCERVFIKGMTKDVSCS